MKPPIIKRLLLPVFLICLFVSLAEPAFCRECNPWHCSPAASNSAPFTEVKSLDPVDSGQARHSIQTCPICLNLILVANDHVPVFFSSTSATLQDIPRLSQGINLLVYKPPRAAF